MNRAKQPTIKHIAQEAGVSISTVSNVLNGNTSEMSEETLHQVQSVIRKLKYRPNQIARGLVTRRTATIGLILAEIETPLFLQALTSIERGGRSAGYSLLLLHARNIGEEQSALELLGEKQVEGVIFLSTSEVKDESHIRALRNNNLPVVLINRATRHEDIDQVNWDNEASTYAAVNYLAERGHRRIAHLLGPAGRAGTQDRLRGYKRGLAEHNIPYREEYTENGDYTALAEVWRQSARKLISLPERPTAVIASDDTVAAVVLGTLREHGIAVPEQMSVIGIDDQPFLSFLTLTTVRLPIVEAGKHAIDLLIRRIHAPESDVQHVLLPCPLIERATSGPVAAAYSSEELIDRAYPSP